MPLAREQAQRLLAFVERREITLGGYAGALEDTINTAEWALSVGRDAVTEIARVRDEYDDERARFTALILADAIHTLREVREDSITAAADWRDEAEQWAAIRRRWPS